MKLTELTFNKLYQQIVFNLKNLYSRANSSFTLASPFGQILQSITAIFQLNTLNVQNLLDLVLNISNQKIQHYILTYLQKCYVF